MNSIISAEQSFFLRQQLRHALKAINSGRWQTILSRLAKPKLIIFTSHELVLMTSCWNARLDLRKKNIKTKNTLRCINTLCTFFAVTVMLFSSNRISFISPSFSSPSVRLSI